MPVMLDPSIKQLATAKNFAAMCVNLPNGQIASHVMWVDATDEHLLINTEVHRAKYRAIEADPRVTVTVWNAENPYQYGEVRGTVASEVRGDAARAHIDTLARKYTGADYSNTVQSERVILQIVPERQRTMGL
jgi:PPOX class probable F420-dependent enzyme